MPTIAVVDDRQESRDTLARALRLTLRNEWQIVSQEPLPQLDDYPSWISAEKISVLVLDELLNEQPTVSGTAVMYRGNELVHFLRQRLSTLPIFIVTAHASDPDLRARFGEVEDVIDRTAFNQDRAGYGQRFARASQRYLEAFDRDLAVLSQIAAKTAAGDAVSPAERDQLTAIQQRIDLTFSIEHIESRSQWVAEMEAVLRDYDQLRQDIQARVEHTNAVEKDRQDRDGATDHG